MRNGYAEFTNYTTQKLISIRMSDVSAYGEYNVISSEDVTLITLTNGEHIILDITYDGFKTALEVVERQQYYNMEATRKL